MHLRAPDGVNLLTPGFPEARSLTFLNVRAWVPTITQAPSRTGASRAQHRSEQPLPEEHTRQDSVEHRRFTSSIFTMCRASS